MSTSRTQPDALLWNAPPIKAATPKARHPIWTVTKDGMVAQAVLLGHGEYGWECQIFENDRLLIGRRWNVYRLALDHADEKRLEYEAADWREPTTTF